MTETNQHSDEYIGQRCIVTIKVSWTGNESKSVMNVIEHELFTASYG